MNGQALSHSIVHCVCHSGLAWSLEQQQLKLSGHLSRWHWWLCWLNGFCTNFEYSGCHEQQDCQVERPQAEGWEDNAEGQFNRSVNWKTWKVNPKQIRWPIPTNAKESARWSKTMCMEWTRSQHSPAAIRWWRRYSRNLWSYLVLTQADAKECEMSDILLMALILFLIAVIVKEINQD